MMIADRELFVPFEHFPWFRHAPIGKIVNVQLVSEQHLHWPDLDIDLEVDSILNPERYPLVSKVQEPNGEYSTSETRWDREKVDDAVLALLQLTLHDERRAWKGLTPCPSP